MSLGSEFKEFAMKGSVVDLAVGVVIGAAFGKIVASLVGDVIMPPLGLVIGSVNFTDLAAHIGTDPAGKAVLLKYGTFLQTVFEFLLIALVLRAHRTERANFDARWPKTPRASGSRNPPG
jgi:large conductance mechanosensitive channel